MSYGCAFTLGMVIFIVLLSLFSYIIYPLTNKLIDMIPVNKDENRLLLYLLKILFPMLITSLAIDLILHIIVILLK